MDSLSSIQLFERGNVFALERLDIIIRDDCLLFCLQIHALVGPPEFEDVLIFDRLLLHESVNDWLVRCYGLDCLFVIRS